MRQAHHPRRRLRQERAALRAEERAVRSNAEQIAALDARHVRATHERARLLNPKPTKGDAK